MPNTATPPPPPAACTANTCSCDHTIPDDPALATSYEYCRRLTRTRARNFYYGMKLTPEPKRSAMYAVYAYMRACDDLADDATDDPHATRQHIEAFRQQTTLYLQTNPPPSADNAAKGTTSDQTSPTFWPAFRHTMRTYPIDPALLNAMLDGQLRDLDPAPFITFDDLYQYCYNVASVVGLTCISVWGYTGGQETRQLAEQRGVAFQLTNILRDLVEDAQRGRLYLPTDELDRFNFTPDTLRAQLLDRRPSPDLARLIAHNADRARDYYQRSSTLESFIDTTCRPTSRAVASIYRALLEKIARRPQRILTERVRLTKLHKVIIALTASRKSA